MWKLSMDLVYVKLLCYIVIVCFRAMLKHIEEEVNLMKKEVGMTEVSATWFTFLCTADNYVLLLPFIGIFS